MSHNVGSLLLALLLAMSSALAQTENAQTENSQTRNALPDRIAVARCAYAQTDEVCAPGKTSSQAAAARVDDSTLAQSPRQYPGPVAGAPTGRAAYPGPWMSPPSPGHVLVGALIGFGFGAAAGAKNGGVGGAFAVGTLVGLLGGAIGATIPSFPRPSRYRRGWSDYDEDASRSKPASSRHASTAHPSARPDPARSTAHAENPQSLSAGTP